MGDQGDSATMGSSNTSTGQTNFVPLVKIKQEDTSMDEEETTTPQPSWKEKYKHLLKTFEVKVEPLENLKAKAGRLFKTQQTAIASAAIAKATAALSKPSNVSLTSFTKVKSPQANTKAKLKNAKSPLKVTLASSSDSDSSSTKSNAKKTTVKSFPLTNGPNVFFQKPDKPLSPISTTPRLIMMKDPQVESGKKQKAVPVPSSPRKVLPKDDLRHQIAPKEGIGKVSAIEKEVEPELGEDLEEEDLEEDLDSMSIHADDDDLLDSDNELGDLNELGKMFAGESSEKKKEPKQRGSISKSNKTSQCKRKHSESNLEQTKMIRLENSTAKPAIQGSNHSIAKPIIPESRDSTTKPATQESKSHSDGDMKQDENKNKNANSRKASNRNDKKRGNRKRRNSAEARNPSDEHRPNNRPNSSQGIGLLPTPGVNADAPIGLGLRIPRYSDKQERRTSDDSDNRGRWRPQQQQQNGDVFMSRPNFEGRGRAPRPFRPNFQQQLAPMHRGGQGMRFMRLPFVQQFQNRPDFQQRPGQRPHFDHALKQDFQQRPPFEHAQNQGPRMQASNFIPNGFKGPHGNTHIPPLMMQETIRHRVWHKGDIGPEETGASKPDATNNRGNGIACNPDNDQKVKKLYERLRHCCTTGDFSDCVTICREILKTSGDINVEYLESVLFRMAAEPPAKFDAEMLTFIFENIRKAREKTVYKVLDFSCAIEAFLKLGNVDSAIDLALEMGSRGFPFEKTLLLSIKTGIFECSITNMDRVIEFCDELEKHNLVSNRLVKEILNQTTIDELRSKTKSKQILNILKDVKVPEQPLLSPTLQMMSPTWNDEVATLIQKISEISPPENIPSDHIVQLIDCIKTPAHAFLVTGRLSKLPPKVLSSISSETWNEFLMKSCDGPFAHLQLASQIQGIMTSNGIAVQNRLSFQIVCSLLKADLPKDALRILHQIDLDSLTSEDVTDDTNTCLCDMLTREEMCDVEDAKKIIMILIKGERNPPENKMVHLISLLKASANYQEIDDVIKQMQMANITPSWETYNIAFSALENWDDNPEAVIDVFSAMKRSYPKSRVSQETPIKCSFGSVSSLSSLSTPRTFEAKDTELLGVDKVPRSATRVCNYFNNGEHCPHGDKCRFAHMLPAPSIKSPFEEMLNGQARLESTTSTRKNSIDINKQYSGYTSNGSANHPITTARSVSSDSPVYTLDYRRFFNKMKFAEQSHNFKEVCKLYTEMRNKKVHLDNPILLSIYNSLLDDKPSERFDDLSQLVKSEVPVVHTINEEEEETDRAGSPLIVLQDADQEYLGRLAVQLIFHCVEKDDFVEAYQILHLLHALQINYYYFDESFDENQPNRTQCEITMTAVKVCLRLNERQLNGALEVLRGANYGLPTTTGEILSSDDVELRRSVLMELTKDLLLTGEFEDAYEVLERLDPEDDTSAASSREFNSFLLRWSAEDKVENATILFEFITSKELKYDREAFSEYLNCMARNKQFDRARELFKIGAQLEIYPPQEMTDPYMFELPCSLTRFEMLFMLEEHLKKIRRTVFEGKGEIKPLMKVQSGFQIIFKENYELFETSQEQNRIAKENMAYVLIEMMKPPLKVIETENPDEPIVIGFNSIMGWYTDKPGKDMQQSNSSDNSTPVASPPSRRAVQIKEHTNSDFTSQPLLTISADDVTMRTVGRQSSMDKQIISEAVCERVKHYLFLERVKPEALEACCQTLSRSCYNRLLQNGRLQSTQDNKGRLTREVFDFVDIFFDEHDTFVQKS